ncbi:MAG: redoxin family protein [Planctomycetota bacterium]
MHLLRPSLALAASLLCAAPALAATPKVGDEAPELGSATWVMNKPAQDSIKALKGEVVFVEHWGVKCPPCRATIPHIEKMQNTYGSRGLHIFTFERQNHTADQVKAAITESKGGSYPVSAGGGDGYRGDGTIPVAWLIGVDGKVIWQGNPAAAGGQLDQLIEGELAKVRFPGLGKNDFHKDVVPAAKAYMKQDLSGARDLAKKALEKSEDAQAKADAQFLVDKVDELAKKQLERLESLKSEGNLIEAYELLNWFSGAFKKSEEGEKAKAALAELKKDKTFKKELEAAKKLEKVLAMIKAKPQYRVALLEKFLKDKKVEGTRAAAEAERMAAEQTK